MNTRKSGWVASDFSSSMQAANAEEELDINKLLGFLWFKKWRIILATLIAALLGILYVQTATPQYDSSASIIITPQEKGVSGLDDVLGGFSDDDKEIKSQIEVMKSRQVVGATVDTLKLDEDPEFVERLREKGFFKKYLSMGLDFVRTTLGGPATAEGEKQQLAPRELAIDALSEKLRINALIKTNVFVVNLETENADKSALIINTLADAFIADQIEFRKQSTETAAKWLSSKVYDLGIELENAEQEAAKYRIETERTVTEADVQASNALLKSARGRLDSFLSDLERETGSNVPRTARERQRLASLSEDVTRYKEIVAKQSADLLTLRQLDREAVASAEIYEHFLTRLNEVEVQKGIQESDIRVLSRAIPRYEATKPKKTRTVIIFALLGLVLSAIYHVMRNAMDQTFTDPAQLEPAFGITVVGTIPRAPIDDRKLLLDYAKKKPKSALMESIRNLRTSISPFFTESEDENGQKRGSIIVMTSSVPGEGKTTSSVLLSVNFAALGKKVLLIECDLRRSTFQAYFGKERVQELGEQGHKDLSSKGLLYAINPENDYTKAIWNSKKAGIDVISGGGSGELNAADIFAAPGFASFLDQMRTQYDMIVLDSPPVLPVPDARLIAKVSDAVIYAVHSASTQRSTVNAGLRLFENVGIKVDGIMLTQIKRGKGYGYGGYGTYNSPYYTN